MEVVGTKRRPLTVDFDGKGSAVCIKYDAIDGYAAGYYECEQADCAAAIHIDSR